MHGKYQSGKLYPSSFKKKAIIFIIKEKNAG
jgi:hypothetical protein